MAANNDVQDKEPLTVYGLMFGIPLNYTLGEISSAFEARDSHELCFEAAFGVTIGAILDYALGGHDPRALAVAATALGPVAYEIDRRGETFPSDESERLQGFETWKRVFASENDYVTAIPSQRLQSMHDVISEAIGRIGPWGAPTYVGSLIQAQMVIEKVLYGRGEIASDTDVIGDLSTGLTPEHSIAPAQPATIFISYSHADEKHREQLEKHLSPLRHQGLVDVWHDRKIIGGMSWKKEIDQQLESSDIVLMLISADFVSSDYCYGVEMERALQRHKEGTAIVVPIMLRPVSYSGLPFADLQMLPKDAKPISEWRTRDAAWTSIAKALSLIVRSRIDSIHSR